MNDRKKNWDEMVRRRELEENKDRIRVMALMGWTDIDVSKSLHDWGHDHGLHGKPPGALHEKRGGDHDDQGRIPLPDPFEDANDDVSILNLALTMEPEWAMEFFDELKYDHVAEYKVGHFARALVSVSNQWCQADRDLTRPDSNG